MSSSNRYDSYKPETYMPVRFSGFVVSRSQYLATRSAGAKRNLGPLGGAEAVSIATWWKYFYTIQHWAVNLTGRRARAGYVSQSMSGHTVAPVFFLGCAGSKLRLPGGQPPRGNVQTLAEIGVGVRGKRGKSPLMSVVYARFSLAGATTHATLPPGNLGMRQWHRT